MKSGFTSTIVVAATLAGGWLASASPAPADETWESGRTPAGLYWEAAGHGEPVVLLHGFTLDRRMWDHTARTLAATHRVIRYDQRGHGLSDPWTAPFAQHDDLLDLFEALGLGSAVLVGLSSGAEIALDFALAYPQRVTRLVLASPGLSGYRPTGSMEWMKPVFEALGAGETEKAARLWAGTPLLELADPRADEAMREIVTSNWRVWTYPPELRRPLEPPAVGRLGEIRAPTLVLLGAEDLPDTHRIGDLLTSGIAGCRLVVLDSAGHLVNLAAPDRFEAELLGFLSELAAPAAESAH